jgi:4-amino-4-deoxy-L-arabinose transferase-like glycosyltransferase
LERSPFRLGWRGNRVLRMLSPQPLVQGPKRWTSRDLRASLAFAVLLGMATVVRLWELGSVPTVFFCDEADNTGNAIQILQGVGPGWYGLDWKPQPAVAVRLIAASVWTLGPSVEAVRLPSALMSVVALVPFFLLARRQAGTLASLVATALLALHPGYLHFSRAGWENVQTCLWTLIAMEAATRATESGSRRCWILAGAAAGVGALVYFSGRAILPFLLLFGIAAAATEPREGRIRGLIAIAWLLAGFVVVTSPLVPEVWRNWPKFNQRPAYLLLTHGLAPGAGALEMARLALHNTWRGLRPFLGLSSEIHPRYFLPDRPFLDRVQIVLLGIGAIASLRRPRQTALWWLAFLVPLVLTQALPLDSPNLARGIALLPVAYLFVALGIDGLSKVRSWARAVVLAAVLVLATGSAVCGVRDYFVWARTPGLAVALQPAVALDDFDRWWVVQTAHIRRTGGWLTVDQWLERLSSPSDSAPRRSIRGPAREGIDRSASAKAPGD